MPRSAFSSYVCRMKLHGLVIGVREVEAADLQDDADHMAVRGWTVEVVTPNLLKKTVVAQLVELTED